MSTDAFRDFVLERLVAPDGRRCKLHFRTNPDILPEFPAFHGSAPVRSIMRHLNEYREVDAFNPKDARMLTTQKQWAMRS